MHSTQKNIFISKIFKPENISSIIFFRIAFGAIFLWEVCRYFEYGWIEKYWIKPGFHFTYYGFDWISPWSGNGMYIHFVILGILAVLIMVGLFYRISTILFFLGFTYVFLLDQATYLNHFYLISLISFLMIFIPAHKSFSLDSLRKPSIKSNTIPLWTIWLLRFQIGIVYFFGGLAKFNTDWLNGEPMRMWLSKRIHYSFIGSYFEHEWMVYLFSYGGLFLDLLIVPFLLWKRTRAVAFIIAVLFHLTNSWLFSIGIFPFLAISATTIFFQPSWPKKLFKSFGFIFKKKGQKLIKNIKPYKLILQTKHYVIAILIFIYLSLQVIVPLRHFIYPGDVNWTEEGHRFSWHMKLRDKNTQAFFYVTDMEKNIKWEVNSLKYLKKWQLKSMSGKPDMILQFAHHIADEMNKKGYEKIQVHAEVISSLNGRKHQFLIHPNVDLATQSRTLTPANWIIPLKD